MADTTTSSSAGTSESPRTKHDPVSFEALFLLAGPGPVPEPQLCRACERPSTLPKLLDCLHSVCGECVATAVAASPFTDCPTCDLQSRTKDRIPDYVVEHFLAVSEGHRTTHVCALHEDAHGAAPEAATFYCCTCYVFMCSVCNSDHRHHVSFGSHATVFLDDLTPEMVRVPVTCPTHGSRQLISGFCTTCRVSVCVTCTSSTHNTHTVVADGLDTVIYAEARRALDEELARPLQLSKLDGMAMTLRTLDELLTAGTSNVKTQNAVIDEWARDGPAARQVRADVLRAELVAKWDVRSKALITQRRDVARRVHAFAQAQSYATALCRIAAPREVLMASAFVKRQMSAFRSWLRPVQPCVSRDHITVILDAMGAASNATMHGHVTEPTMRLWMQGCPPHTGGDREYIYMWLEDRTMHSAGCPCWSSMTWPRMHGRQRRPCPRLEPDWRVPCSTTASMLAVGTSMEKQ